MFRQRYILEQFEREAGYKFGPNSSSTRVNTTTSTACPRRIQDFQAFQRREVANWPGNGGRHPRAGQGSHDVSGRPLVGTEPFMEEFKSIGLDAVVGSVGNGSTLRLISDIPGVKYTGAACLTSSRTPPRGRRPCAGGQGKLVTARRAILRKPIDRIGYGGYLKLACAFRNHRLCGERVQ